jgi:hypothetical protein
VLGQKKNATHRADGLHIQVCCYVLSVVSGGTFAGCFGSCVW